jgi:hypothetical protein
VALDGTHSAARDNEQDSEVPRHGEPHTMSRKRKRGNKVPVRAIPLADGLPPESSPSKYCSQLVFTDAEGGEGPLCVVGRELQLVWYDTERDRARERNGNLVSVLEFRDCRRSRDHRGERYQFKGLLLEDLSGEYREWLGHQEHQGRPFGEDADVLKTEVRFSVAVRETMEAPYAVQAHATEPFSIEHPDVEELSSPQLDMLFDVMSLLYQNIAAMRLMEDLRTQHVAELAE